MRLLAESGGGCWGEWQGMLRADVVSGCIGDGLEPSMEVTLE